MKNLSCALDIFAISKSITKFVHVFKCNFIITDEDKDCFHKSQIQILDPTFKNQQAL